MDNKSLIVTLVLVFVVGLMLGDLSSSGPTGQVARGGAVTSVAVSPTSVDPGGLLTVSVNPGSEGSGTEYSIYRENQYGQRIRLTAGAEYEFCRASGNVCTTYQTFSVRTLNDWAPGAYYIQVYDHGTESYIRAYFTLN